MTSGIPVDDVVVDGAGVIGLTTALLLARAGAGVRVRAADIPGRTSLAAGAMWGPYLVESSERVDRWSRYSLEVFRELAADPATGVHIASGIEASRKPGCEPPPWAVQLPGFRSCTPDELPPGFGSGSGHRFSSPLIDMAVYLDYLQDQLRAAGVGIDHATTADPDGERGCSTLVNCTGMGAQRLLGDDDLRPVRGQSVVVANPGITEFFVGDDDSADLVCIFPHRDTVVLGGIAVDGETGTEPDPAVADAILRRCAAVEPRLAGAEVLAHRVGTRPARAKVRIEAEVDSTAAPLVLHNYGHGGAGVTLSWGCAREIVQLWQSAR